MTPHPRLHFVTGKGGVGKSTVCAALAIAAHRAGARVLAIELVTPGGLSRILGARPDAPGEPCLVRPGLSLSYVDGAAALGEYLGRVLWSRRLTDAVLSHSAYRAFAAAAPGVSELMAIGKIRDELLQRDGLRRRYDVVVVDAGASGHALPYLRMASATRRTFTSRGRVRREAEKIDALLCDPNQTAVHVVAVPEHMPLREAETLLQSLGRDPALPIGAVLVNRCLPIAPSGFDDELVRFESLRPTAARDAIVASMHWRRGWERLQAEHLARFEAHVACEIVRLPERSSGRNIGLGEVDLDPLVEAIGEACL